MEKAPSSGMLPGNCLRFADVSGERLTDLDCHKLVVEIEESIVSFLSAYELCCL